MHLGSRALAAGADFRLLGAARDDAALRVPVVAVCAVRTGCGKSQTTRHVVPRPARGRPARRRARHPMPYGDLDAAGACSASRRSRTSTRPTARSRSARSTSRTSPRATSSSRASTTRRILREARGRGRRDRLGRRQQRPAVLPARPAHRRRRPAPAGHEMRYHPGETNLRMARRDRRSTRSTRAPPEGVEAVLRLDPRASTRARRSCEADSPITVEDDPRRSAASACSASRTGRRSRTAR